MPSRRLAAARRGGRASGSSRRRSRGRCCGGAAGRAWRRRSSGRSKTCPQLAMPRFGGQDDRARSASYSPSGPRARHGGGRRGQRRSRSRRGYRWCGHKILTSWESGRSHTMTRPPASSTCNSCSTYDHVGTGAAVRTVHPAAPAADEDQASAGAQSPPNRAPASACGDCVDTGSLTSVLVTAASLDRA